MITYTPATDQNAASAPESAISFTVGGTAYNALSLAQVQQALRLMDLSIKQVLFDKTTGSNATGTIEPGLVSGGIPRQTT